MIENDSHNKSVFDKEYWLWNYRGLRGGQTLVYVAKNEKGNIVGNYHFIILDGHYPNEKTKYTLIQDAAVDPRYRNLGIFKSISLKGKADLEDRGVKIIETFPNVRSKHSFSKNTQYTIINIMPSFVQVYDGAYLAQSKFKLLGIEKILGKLFESTMAQMKFYKSPKDFRIQVDQVLDEEVVHVYSEFSGSYKFGLIKDSNYLQWRFLDKPGYQHYFGKIYTPENKLVALGVFKPDVIMGARCLVLLDLAYIPGYEDFFLHLLTDVRKNHLTYFQEKFALLYSTINGKISNVLWKAGLISLPRRFNPRVIPLMVSNTEKIEGFYDPKNWQVCLCDWDVL